MIIEIAPVNRQNIEAIIALAEERDAHIFALVGRYGQQLDENQYKTAKRPHHSIPPWQKTPRPNLRQASQPLWSQAPHLVAVVPASFNLLAIDIDAEGDAALQDLYRKHNIKPARLPSTRGNHDLFWAPANLEVKQGTWQQGKCRGETRYDKGYIIAWDLKGWLSVLHGMTAASQATQEFVNELMLRKPKAAPAKRGRGRPRNAQAYVDAAMANPDAHYPPGQRESQLTEDIWKLLGMKATDDDWAILKDAWLAAHAPKDRAKYEYEFDERLSRAAAKFNHPDYDPANVFQRYDAATLHTCLTNLGMAYTLDVRGNRLLWRTERNDFNIDGTNHEVMCSLIEDISLVYGISNGNRSPRPLRFQRPDFKQFMTANIQSRNKKIDPFLLYLEREIPTANNSDTIDGLFQMLWDAHCPADEGTDLVRWASRAVWLGAVQRAYEPGCFLDESVVLMGGKRFGKSTFIKQMFPEDRQHIWVNDQFDIMMEPREKREATNGRVIIELGEMHGVGRFWDKQKAWLTSRWDVARTVYADEETTIPRRFIIIGTADRMEVLPREETIRRFCVIELREACKVWEIMPAIRAQCWAEAKYLYEQGVRANMPDDLSDLQLRQNQKYTRRNEIFDEIVQALDNGPYTITGILKENNLPRSHTNSRHLKAALAMHGYLYGRYTAPNGKRMKGYRLNTQQSLNLTEGSNDQGSQT